MSLTYGSVCSGIEAASVAWHPFGWRPVWFAEVDKAASAVLAHRFPQVPNLGDMTLLAAKVRTREIPAPDVLVGGTPCQSFSVAGMRGGLSDARGQLTIAFVDLADAIDEIRLEDGLEPVIIVWENVPGVLNHADNPLGCFLGALAGDDDALEPGPRPESGRSAACWTWDKNFRLHRPKWPVAGAVAGPERAIAWRVLDAQYFGLAQRRRRVFAVASARAWFDPAAILLEFDGVRRDSPPRREAGEGLTHAVAPCLTSSGRGVERTGDTRGQDAVVAVIDDGRIRGAAGVAFGGGRRSGPVDVAACLVAAGNKQDFEVETFVVEPALYAIMPMNSGKDFKAREVDIAQPLMAGGPVSGAQGGDYVVQPVAFGSKGAGLDATADCAPTLRASGHAESHSNGGRTPAVAYSVALRGREHGAAAEMGDEVAGCLRASTGGGDKPHVLAPVAVCVTAPVTHTLKAEGFDASEDGTGRGQPIVPAMAFQTSGYGASIDEHVASTMQASYARLSNQVYGVIEPTMAVRRLMPVECERLQGFPDNWTLVPTGKSGKLAADGPRYKQCGNSMATTVMRWIGSRVAAALINIDDEFEALL